MSFGISIADIIKLCDLAGKVYKNCSFFSFFERFNPTPLLDKVHTKGLLMCVCVCVLQAATVRATTRR